MIDGVAGTVLTVDDLAARLARVPRRTALFTDFDGTLAPIVTDPATARPAPGTVEALDALTTRYRRVGVLSGRPLDYLAPLLPATVDIGALYGLEQRVGGQRTEHPGADRWRAVVTTVATEAAQALAAYDGVGIEAKGLSLTLHVRRAPQHLAAVVAFAADAARRHGLEAREAKASVELHPPVAVDKGTLLTRWADGADVVAFFGDDLGDLAAFSALGDLAARLGIEAYRVVVLGRETPVAVRAVADVLLEDPAALAALLQRLVTAAS